MFSDSKHRRLRLITLAKERTIDSILLAGTTWFILVTSVLTILVNT